jgi:hypothetical protein
MSTWPGNQYWFSPDGRAAVAYRAIAAVAVTVGGPYGDPVALDSAITGFARFCEHRGLQPCLYGVTAQARAVTQRLGWQSVQIAEDTLLPLERLQFTGKKWQDVRTALNKAAKEGITAQWWTYPQAPPDLVGQIREISQAWMADKGLPEMGFTLGGLDQLNDPDIRCLLAVGADRKVHGITSWMPVYASGRPVGWTLDFMRRNTEPGTFRGVMEFLIATAALTLREEGARFVSLSGAPLARLDRGERPSVLQRLLDRVADTVEPVYGFQSLLHFKAKFQPVYQPLYLTYPDPAALGSIATAIGRAYLPHLTSRQALRLLAKLRWPRTNCGRLAAPRRPGPARSPDQADLLEPVTGTEPLTCHLPTVIRQEFQREQDHRGGHDKPGGSSGIRGLARRNGRGWYRAGCTASRADPGSTAGLSGWCPRWRRCARRRRLRPGSRAGGCRRSPRRPASSRRG